MKNYCILGNCQANAIAATLQVCAGFKNTYQFNKVTPIHRITAEDHQGFINALVPNTDLFIYQPISDGYRGGGFGFREVMSNLPKYAKIISYPSIQFYGYQASASTIKNLPLEARHLSRDLFGLAGSDLFHYSQIILAYLLGFPKDEAHAVFHEGFVDDGMYAIKRCAESLAHLKHSEEKHDIDIKIHDVIADRFRNEQLFWSPRHPTGEILGFIAESILSHLAIAPTADEKNKIKSKDPLKIPQYPMQGFIREALNLGFKPIESFMSKSIVLSTHDMIEAYYDVYARIGHAELQQLTLSVFPKVPSVIKLIKQRSAE